MKTMAVFGSLDPHSCVFELKKSSLPFLSSTYDRLIRRHPTNTCSVLVNALSEIKLQEATCAYLTAVRKIRLARRALLLEYLN